MTTRCIGFAYELGLPRVSTEGNLVFFHDGQRVEPSLESVKRRLVIGVHRRLCVVKRMPAILPDVTFVDRQGHVFVECEHVDESFEILRMEMGRHHEKRESTVYFAVDKLRDRRVNRRLRFGSVVRVLNHRVDAAQLMISGRTVNLVVPYVFISTIGLASRSRMAIFAGESPGEVPTALAAGILLWVLHVGVTTLEPLCRTICHRVWYSLCALLSNLLMNVAHFFA